ncbi:dihydrolipoamide acetyltransferase family protein [Actinoplanes sp. NPDC049599]|uniref:dihydrolipoamide acetyltransferase family protein n=1 Tax=Actinoplanes sp. NPDC049599 TaxID=3363903 RepID=UPI00379E55D1
MSAQIFLLPDLGEGLTEAEVVRWLVHEGDTVEVDQPVVEVETAKSLVEVPTPYAGRVAVRHAAEGATLDVGKPLLTVAAVVPAAETYREEEQAGSGNVLIGYGTTVGAATTRRRRPRVRGREAAPVAGRRVPLVISPLVRRLAREGGIDLSTVEATGIGGVIIRADVERALARSSGNPSAAAPAARIAPAVADRSAVAGVQAAGVEAVPGERRVPLSGFRKAVSAALSRSRAEIPEATVWVDVDATPLWELRAQHPDGPGLLAYLARFTVAALRQYPMLNARVDTERQEIVEFDRINLGIAVQGERGLVVPAVAGAEALTTGRLDQEIRRVTADARAGRVTGAEAGTFTLNNYGGFRVDGSAAIINHPQVAILGFGRILDRPWVVDGVVCVRKITQMSFVFDHRVCDGGTAAGFMRSVADAIEDPASAIARL